MLKPELVEILQCLKCRGPLTYEVHPDSPSRGRLICYQCRLVFRVENDIPILLEEEATPLDAQEATRDQE